MEDEERTELLKIILSTYFTVRGFSFTCSYMELDKQLNSKNAKPCARTLVVPNCSSCMFTMHNYDT